LNPFATEEDDDSGNEDENERDFSIGDLDVEVGARGLLGGGGVGEDKGKNVNVGTPPAMSSSTSTNTTTPLGIGRASFPSMWPFGASTSPSHKGASFAVEGGLDDGGTRDNQCHFRGSSANGSDVQSDESDSSNSSDEELGYGDRDLEREGRATEFGSDGQGGKRRLSVTTEAKRRTSLEDDDDEEDGVVHVGMEVGKEIVGEREGGDDEELVEIQHAEMQGVEGEAVGR
jgi:hypothetical protein